MARTSNQDKDNVADMDAGPKGTDRKTSAQSVAMDELLNRRFVSAVVARSPSGMIFIQRAVVQYLLVNSAG